MKTTRITKNPNFEKEEEKLNIINNILCLYKIENIFFVF